MALRWVIAAVVTVAVGRKIWLEKEKLKAYHLRPAGTWLASPAICARRKIANTCGNEQQCADASCYCWGFEGRRDECGDSCVNFQNDASNCGGCGTRCAAATPYCVGGVCKNCVDAGKTLCGGVCTDTQTDNANCGACGVRCGAGTACVAGECVGGECGLDCDTGFICCNRGEWPGRDCFDPMIDPWNCGGCSNICRRDMWCVGGVCACQLGEVACGGICTNTDTDVANCGACGRVCDDDRPLCTAGVCRSCPRGSVNCGGVCAYTDWDWRNCGACGVRCDIAAGEWCNAGECSDGWGYY